MNKPTPIDFFKSAKLTKIKNRIHKQLLSVILYVELIAEGNKIFEYIFQMSEQIKNIMPMTTPPQTNEIPPYLQLCLENLKNDYETNGIVIIKKEKSFQEYQSCIDSDKSAGVEWAFIESKLCENNFRILEKAARMQGGGQLIGIFEDGKLCIKDRGNKGVLFGRDAKGHMHTITSDDPDRELLIEKILKNKKVASYWEMLNTIEREGYCIPMAPEDDQHAERTNENNFPVLVKATLVVTKCPYTHSDFAPLKKNYDYPVSILNCGDLDEEQQVWAIGTLSPWGSILFRRNACPNSYQYKDGLGAIRFLIE